jgi:hypothetical protein
LTALIAAGRTVYLHCTEGVGRSPTVAIGYLHWSLGWGFDAALSHVEQARQCLPRLEAHRPARWNPPNRVNERGIEPFIGRILLHGRFRLFAKRHAGWSKRLLKPPDHPPAPTGHPPAVRAFLRPEKGFADFKPLFLPLTCLLRWRADFPCPPYTRHSASIAREGRLHAAGRTATAKKQKSLCRGPRIGLSRSILIVFGKAPQNLGLERLALLRGAILEYHPSPGVD